MHCSVTPEQRLPATSLNNSGRNRDYVGTGMGPLVPGPVLSTLHVLTHGVLVTPYEGGTIEMGTLRAQEVVSGHPACTRQDEEWSPAAGLGPYVFAAALHWL